MSRKTSTKYSRQGGLFGIFTRHLSTLCLVDEQDRLFTQFKKGRESARSLVLNIGVPVNHVPLVVEQDPEYRKFARTRNLRTNNASTAKLLQARWTMHAARLRKEGYVLRKEVINGAKFAFLVTAKHSKTLRTAISKARTQFKR